jgi:dTDP-4-dehydrorhamnose reductase
MRFLVLGAGGMLGHRVFLALRARHPETVGTLRQPLADPRVHRIPLLAQNMIGGVDAENLCSLGKLLRERKPRVVVNCVGVVKQRAQAREALPSIALNALLPHRLAAWCAEWGGRLIHISTDCVFSGRRGNYTEEDASDAEDLYGRSKYLGEVTTENALTLRTSMIGRELFHSDSLLEWVLAQQGKQVKGYRRALFSGLTTPRLAALIADLAERPAGLNGLYHVASDPISKHDLVCLIRDAFRLDLQVLPDDDVVCDRSLSGERFAAATGYRCPPWPQMVAELAADPTPYEEWRE